MFSNYRPYKITLLNLNEKYFESLHDNYKYNDIREFKISLQNADVKLDHFIFIGDYTQDVDLNRIFKNINENKSYDKLPNEDIEYLNTKYEYDFTENHNLTLYNSVLFVPTLINKQDNLIYIQELIFNYLNLKPNFQYLFGFNNFTDENIDIFKKQLYNNIIINNNLKKTFNIIDEFDSCDNFEQFNSDINITNKILNYLLVIPFTHEYQDSASNRINVDNIININKTFDNLKNFNLILNKNKNLSDFGNLDNNEILVVDYNNISASNDILGAYARDPKNKKIDWNTIYLQYFPLFDNTIKIKQLEINNKIKISNLRNGFIFKNIPDQEDLFIDENIKLFKFSYNININYQFLDILSVFNQLQLSTDIPFSKIYETLSGEQVYKLFKNYNKDKINKDLLINWITHIDYIFEQNTITPVKKKKYQLIYKIFMNKVKTNIIKNGIISSIIDENDYEILTDDNKKLRINREDILNHSDTQYKIDAIIKFYEYNDNYITASLKKNEIIFTILNNDDDIQLKYKIFEKINNFISLIKNLEFINDQNLITDILYEPTKSFFDDLYNLEKSRFDIKFLNLVINLKLKNVLNLDKLIINKLFRKFSNYFNIEYDNLFDDDKGKYFDVEYYDGNQWNNVKINKKINDYTYEIKLSDETLIVVNEINIKRKDMKKKFYELYFNNNNTTTPVKIYFKKTNLKSKFQNIIISNITNFNHYNILKFILLKICNLYLKYPINNGIGTDLKPWTSFSKFIESELQISEIISEKNKSTSIDSNENEPEPELLDIDQEIEGELFDEDDEEIEGELFDTDDDEEEESDDQTTGDKESDSDSDDSDTENDGTEIAVDIYYDNFNENTVLARLKKYELLWNTTLPGEKAAARMVQKQHQPKLLTDSEKNETNIYPHNNCINIYKKKSGERKIELEYFCMECTKSKTHFLSKNSNTDDDKYYCKFLKLNNNWYICPEIWDFKENVPLRVDDLNFKRLGSYLSNLDINPDIVKKIGTDLYGSNYNKDIRFVNRNIKLKEKSIKDLEFFIKLFFDVYIDKSDIDNDDLYKELLIFIITSKEVQTEKTITDQIILKLKMPSSVLKSEIKKFNGKSPLIDMANYNIEDKIQTQEGEVWEDTTLNEVDIFDYYKLNIDKDFYKIDNDANDTNDIIYDNLIWRMLLGYNKNIIDIKSKEYGLTPVQIKYLKRFTNFNTTCIDILELSPLYDNRSFTLDSTGNDIKSKETSIFFNDLNDRTYPQFHKSGLPTCARIARAGLLTKTYQISHDSKFYFETYLQHNERKLENQKISALTNITLHNFFAGNDLIFYSEICTSGNIKDKKCFFRKGVDKIKGRSFLYAYIDILNTRIKNKNLGSEMTIDIFKLIDTILLNLTYDEFKNLNNGDLEILFRNRIGRSRDNDSLQNYFEYLISDQVKNYTHFIDYITSNKFLKHTGL